MDSLKDSVATIFSVFQRGKEAPKVIDVSFMKELPNDLGIVVDISIDEKGAIFDPAIHRNWTSSKIADYLAAQLLPQRYRAVENMPRAYPHEASRAHGEAILPYLATLIYLTARQGGAEGAIDALGAMEIKVDNPDPLKAPESLLQGLTQDLRNGMVLYSKAVGGGNRPSFARHSRRIVIEEAVADKRSVFNLFYGDSIPFEFGIRTDLDPDDFSRHERKKMFQDFPETIGECLSFAVDKSIDATFIFHPDVDGTRSEDAANALGVKVSEVLA